MQTCAESNDYLKSYLNFRDVKMSKNGSQSAVRY